MESKQLNTFVKKDNTMGSKHQAKVDLTPSDYARLQEVRKKYGFKSDYQLVGASVRLFCWLLADEGTHKGVNLPEGLREFVADKLYQDYLEQSDGKNYDKRLFSEDKNRPTPPSAWISRFTHAHYQELYERYAGRVQVVRASDGLTPIDIFQDTITRLISTPTACLSYEEFEALALQKFWAEERLLPNGDEVEEQSEESSIAEEIEELIEEETKARKAKRRE